MTANGGKLQLLNSSNAGSVFQITLPVVSLPVGEETPAETVNSESKRVLILDDEVDVAELTAEILRRDAYDVDLTSIGRAMEFSLLRVFARKSTAGAQPRPDP